VKADSTKIEMSCFCKLNWENDYVCFVYFDIAFPYKVLLLNVCNSSSNAIFVKTNQQLFQQLHKSRPTQRLRHAYLVVFFDVSL